MTGDEGNEGLQRQRRVEAGTGVMRVTASRGRNGSKEFPFGGIAANPLGSLPELTNTSGLSTCVTPPPSRALSAHICARKNHVHSCLLPVVGPMFALLRTHFMRSLVVYGLRASRSHRNAMMFRGLRGTCRSAEWHEATTATAWEYSTKPLGHTNVVRAEIMPQGQVGVSTRSCALRGGPGRNSTVGLSMAGSSSRFPQVRV